MSRNELILLLLEQMDRNIIYNIDITKDKVTIYLVNDYFKTIKFDNKIKEQYNQIFK